jgi:vitamin B12 transporter
MLMAALLVLAAGTPARGDEVRTTEPAFVTATKVDTPGERLGASVTVVTEEEIRTYQYTQVEDALRHVPGVEIQRTGSLGKTSGISIRGAGPGQVQVLVDGMRVKSPTLGSVDLAEFSLDAVDRIEIVRGPQSGLYGADAIGGVVNIITRKGRGPISGSVHVEGGSHETFRERVGVQGAVGGFNFNLSGTRYDTSGQFDNDDAGQTSLAGRVGYDFPWKGELSLAGRYARTKVDLPIDGPGVFDPNAQSDLTTWLFNATYKQPITAWWDVQARYGQWANDSLFKDPVPPATDIFSATRSLIETRRREMELINTFTPAPWTAITAGFEHRVESGENRTAAPVFPASFAKEISTLAAFLQAELRLFDRLFITGSVRWEDSDAFESSVTPRVAAAYLITSMGTKLRGTWGRGFRAPTINDLAFPGFANPNLTPERSESWDVGFDQRVWKDRVRFGATYFHNDFEDLIQFVCDPLPPFLCSVINVGKARTRGFEVYAEADPFDWLQVYANYTHLDTVDRMTGLALTRFPADRWNAGVVVTPLDGLSLFAQATVVSSHLASSTIRNPGYHRIDVGGTWRVLGRHGILESLELTARIDNVTDQSYAEVFGFPALGFTALAGIRAQFK